MNHLPEILLSNLFLLFIWGFFELFLRNTKSFQANRFFLLTGSVMAVLLPWLPWQVRVPVHTEPIWSIPEAPAGEMTSFDPGSAGDIVAMPATTPLNWPFVIYFSIVGMLVITFLAQTVRMYLWTRRRPATRWDRYRVVELDKQWPAFSFFGTIYFPEPFEPDRRETITILEHERVHARQLHSIDNIILLTIRILFFYNPAVHFLAGRLRLTHEFLADAATAGINKVEYSQTLIRHQFLVPRLMLMHSFNNQSFLKRRLNMLLKNNTSSRAVWIYLLAAPLAAGMIVLSGWSASAQNPQGKKDDMKDRISKEMDKIGLTKTSDTSWTNGKVNVALAENMDPATIKARLNHAQEEKDASISNREAGQKPELIENQTQPQDADKKVFLIVEEMPTFKGGQINDFRNWVQDNLKYPAEAKANKKQGTVYVSFVVDTLGNPVNINLIRGVEPTLDEEVIRVIKSSPAWKPGKQRGKNVNVSFSLPIAFQLSEKGEMIKPPRTLQKPPAKAEYNGQQVFLIVEDMPAFQGGTIENFRNWVQSGIKYPKLALEKRISGTEYVSFIVDTTGRVVDPKIVRSADPILDAEILRVLCSAPLWTPGRQHGKPVNVAFSIPVRFKLDGQAGDAKNKDSLAGKNLNKEAQPVQSSVNGVVTKEVLGRQGNTVYVDGQRVTEPDTQVFLIVEDMPSFQGGTIDDFRKWMQAHLKYPAMAVENKIQGTVYVSFVVNSKGKIVMPNIVRGVDPILDEEVLRLLKSPPDWKAGMQQGKPVNVSFSIPVNFTLSGKPSKEEVSIEYVGKPDYENKKVFSIVEEMPEFQDGGIKKFVSWAQANVKYPQKAMEESKSGTVEVSFIVSNTGELTDIQITKSVAPSLDEAVMNVVKSSPRWIPGKQRGKDVNVSFTIPIKFILQ